MCSVLSYFSDWRKLVRHGLDSYLEASRRLEDSREYHRRRSVVVDDNYNPGFSVEIPLLWGSF